MATVIQTRLVWPCTCGLRVPGSTQCSDWLPCRGRGPRRQPAPARSLGPEQTWPAGTSHTQDVCQHSHPPARAHGWWNARRSTWMLSTARWQHAASTEQPSWKYHSASSWQTWWRRLRGRDQFSNTAGNSCRWQEGSKNLAGPRLIDC